MRHTIKKAAGIWATSPDIEAYTPGFTAADKTDTGRMGVTILSGTYRFANGWTAQVRMAGWASHPRDFTAIEVSVLRPDVPNDVPRIMWAGQQPATVNRMLTRIACWPIRQPQSGTAVQQRQWPVILRELP